MGTTVTAGLILAALTFGLLAGMARAQPVELTFDIPTDTLWPGVLFWLRLDIDNSGPGLDSAQLFIALDIGTGDYWFWPTWVHYPPDLAWADIAIAVGSAEQEIIPAFTWPAGCGSGSAEFVSAVLDEGVLVSNVAVAPFSWSEETPGTPTPTPTIITATPTFSPTQAPTPDGGFAFAPAGTFVMGSPPSELCHQSNESQHSVTLTRGFQIQQTEVTQAQWVAVFGVNPSSFAGCDPCPVEMVTWFDTVIYCNRISQAAGLRSCYYSDEAFTILFDGTPPVTTGTVYWDRAAPGYRLPTESEWEYACRAGTTSAYSSGQGNTSCEDDPNVDPLAWYWYNSDTGSGHRTHPVAQKQANAWSLYDVHGNVYEWCWDWFATYPPGPVTDPTGPSTGSFRVFRGGSLDAYAEHCRSGGQRFFLDPGTSSLNMGLRPVRAAP